MPHIVRRISLIAFLGLFGLLSPAQADEPVSGTNPPGVHLGWAETDPLVFANELNCNACHGSGELTKTVPAKQAPILTTVGNRVTPQYLRKWLADPQSVKPGTAMPDVLHHLPADNRATTVENLTHYLASLGGGPIDQTGHGASEFQIESGADLYHTVGCVACHAPSRPPAKVKNDPYANIDPEDLEGIDLPYRADPWTPIPHGNLAVKYTMTSLTEFLQNPLHTRPSGRMPSLKLSKSEAELIAAYLLRDQLSEESEGLGTGIDLAISFASIDSLKKIDFADLKVDREGTVTALEFPKGLLLDERGRFPKGSFVLRFTGLISIPTAGEYIFRTSSDDGSLLFIDGKQVVDNDGVHPKQTREGKISLKAGRHPFEVLYFEKSGDKAFSVEWRTPDSKKFTPIPPEVLLHSSRGMVPEGITKFEVDPVLAEAGRKQFAMLGCANCHQVGETKPLAPTAKSLANLNWTARTGCFGDKPRPKTARYALTENQQSAIANGFRDRAEKPENFAEASVVGHMNAMNCYACHERGKRGGVDITRANYFGYEVLVDLGDEGRFPPPLGEPGAKLTDAGFEETFHGQDKYRTYMATRMPHFGRSNIDPMVPLFREADKNAIPDVPSPKRTNEAIDAGRTLTGKLGLGCVNCHAWGDYSLPGAEGLNFLRVPKRINHDWYHAFMTDPQKYKPGTRMPTAWPKGQVFRKELLGGDMDRQIDGIWTYLSLGERGGLPSGLTPGNNLLVVTEDPIVFRTFMKNVGARAITVGFRQRTNAVFDGTRCHLSKAWIGDFVTTKETWEGRAGTYTEPAGRSVLNFPSGPSLARLNVPDSSWPAFDPRSRVVPDGWKWLGYRFDNDRNPIFRYQFENIVIEEAISTGYETTGAMLKRDFLFSPSGKPSPDDAPLYFRVAVGDRIEKSGDRYTVDDEASYFIETAGGKPLIRESDGKRELLIQLAAFVAPRRLTITVTWGEE